MPKSIRTTSNTQTPTNSTLATFKAGDAVLCPFVGNGSYQLFIDDEHGLLSFIAGVNKYHTRADGKQCPNDKSPSIFHDTPANRQIITALYDQVKPTPSQRKVIDTTEADDKEVVLISAFDLRDIACDIQTAISMARLTHDATVTWYDLLQTQLDSINDTLAMTAYAKEVAK